MAATADISTLTIKELSGLKREVVLRGPSLPFQGAPWGGSQRVITTWYPGNGMEATQHVLGPTEKQSSWEGFWRTTQLFRVPTYYAENGSAYQQMVRPFTLWTTLEDMFRLGQRLSVVWQNKTAGDTTRRRVVREGRCVEWEFRPDRADDVAWSFTFDWSGRGVRQQKVLNRRTENMKASLQGCYQAASEAAAELSALKIVSTNKKAPLSADQFTLGDLENLLNAPAALMQSFSRKALYLTNQFAKVGNLLATLKSIPYQLANQGLDIANNAVTMANQFADQMSRRPPEANLADLKTAQLLRSANATSSLYDSFGTMQNKALELRNQVQDSAKDQGDILTTHISRAGETLASISAKYYGTIDHAVDIAKANGLPMQQQTVEPGTILIIPRLDSVQSANVPGV